MVMFDTFEMMIDEEDADFTKRRTDKKSWDLIPRPVASRRYVVQLSFCTVYQRW